MFHEINCKNKVKILYKNLMIEFFRDKLKEELEYKNKLIDTIKNNILYNTINYNLFYLFSLFDPIIHIPSDYTTLKKLQTEFVNHNDNSKNFIIIQRFLYFETGIRNWK